MPVGHSPPGTPGWQNPDVYNLRTVIRNDLVTPRLGNDNPKKHYDVPDTSMSDVIPRQNLKRLRKDSEYVEVPRDVFEKLIADVEFLKNSVLATNDLVKTLIDQNVLLKSELTNCKVNNNKKTSYAETLRSNNPVVVITPKNNQQTSSATKSDIKNKISPTNIAVKNIRKATKGAIVIQCDNSPSCDILKDSVIKKLGENYIVNVPTLLNPRLKIINVSVKHSESVIQELIRKQNDFIPENSDLKLITILDKSTKERQNYTYIFETDPTTYNVLLNREKITIGWDRCRVFENIHISRCFKCLGFNHKAKECTRLRMCLKCSQDHDIKECKSTREECGNCRWANENLKMELNTEHHANSWDCKVLQRRVERARQRILVEQ